MRKLAKLKKPVMGIQFTGKMYMELIPNREVALLCMLLKRFNHLLSDLNEMKAEAASCKLQLDNRQETVVNVCYKSQLAEAGELEALFTSVRRTALHQVLIMSSLKENI